MTVWRPPYFSSVVPYLGLACAAILYPIMPNLAPANVPHSQSPLQRIAVAPNSRGFLRLPSRRRSFLAATCPPSDGNRERSVH